MRQDKTVGTIGTGLSGMVGQAKKLSQARETNRERSERLFGTSQSVEAFMNLNSAFRQLLLGKHYRPEP